VPEQIRPPATPGGHAACVLVGVTPHQPDVVLHTAARLASALGVDLVGAHVDQSAYVVAEHPDGSVDSRPVDPDIEDWSGPVFDRALATHLHQITRSHGVRLRVVELAGEVAHALARLAVAVDAELIVVGSRSGFRAGIRDYLGGSVAVHLAHRQHRPVVVVPLAARPEGPLPWEEA
jgi:nucleotide-binding universal stress UspA family protein